MSVNDHLLFVCFHVSKPEKDGLLILGLLLPQAKEFQFLGGRKWEEMDERLICSNLDAVKDRWEQITH